MESPRRATPKRRVVKRQAPKKSQPPQRLRAPRAPRERVKPRPKPRLGDSSKRLSGVLIVVLLLFVVLIGKIIQLQFTDASQYAAAAAEQRTARITLVAPRGAILDRNGKPLAHSVPASAVYVDPKFVKNAEETARELTSLLGVRRSELLTILKKKKRKDGSEIRFSYIARQLDPEVGQRVRELGLRGIYVLNEQRRDVPGHDLAANIIGFTGNDGNGLEGLEATYDSILSGQNGEREFEVGAHGQPIPDGYKREKPAHSGDDVQLTIDSDLQFQTQRMLTDALRAKGALIGSAVVMDARSGEVLSMASYPTFDAANPIETPQEARGNMATAVVMDPGSTHKGITFAAGLEEGVIDGDTVLTVPPTIRKADATFKDTHWHGTVGMTLPGMLAHSSNVGAIMTADKIGADALYRYQKKFGLGIKTDVGVSGEAQGALQAPENWSGSAYGTIPIGLGVSVTPMQMISAYQIIANDGVRVTPSVVRGTVHDGDVKERDTADDARVISEESARTLRTAMEAVTSEEGTASAAAITGYRVAGKTGTGARVKDGEYMDGEVTSFVGMVPADKPRYVIGVSAHMPGTSGTVASSVFHDLASFTLRHYGVAPTGSTSPKFQVYA